MTPELQEWIRREARDLEQQWSRDLRWVGIRREYSAEDVIRLRGSVKVDHTLARMGAEKLWHLMHRDLYVPALGALTGNQAVQMVRAGLKAIYLSGWQTAADNNVAGQMYPDQSLYPANSVPDVVRRINNALRRADQIEWAERFVRTGGADGRDGQSSAGARAAGNGAHIRDWMVPIVADAEAGFGGPLNAFELMKSMIEAGAAGVHYEDQLASEKKCGHMGGKVLVPTSQHIRTLTAARLGADVCGVATVLVARTDALGASLLTSDVDPRDRKFATGERTPEGFYVVRPGLDAAIERSLAYAPYVDLLWFETSKPDLAEAEAFARAIHKHFPGKLLMYNCSPSFHWKKYLDDATIQTFQQRLGEMGYRFQFITLAGFHALNASMYDLATNYAREGMTAYVKLQEHEIQLEKIGYTAVKHQREVGTGYFDDVAQAISGGKASTLALEGSTEVEQFGGDAVGPAPPLVVPPAKKPKP